MEKKMNFIDIASYQSAIDLDKIFSENPLHGVIVKTTEGMNYINPYSNLWIQWLTAQNKPWGFYHFMNGDDPVAEAKWFYKQTKDYFYKGVPVADFEGRLVSEYGTFYLRKFLDEVHSLSGIRPMVYCSLSVIHEDIEGFRPIAEAGNPLWVAQYADMKEKWLGTPIWQNGSVSPFKKITMHQYSGTGRIKGYDGNVDLDVFYGDETDWNSIVEGHSAQTNQPIELKQPDPTVICDILHNKYGIDDERTTKLINIGYDPESVQKKINELYGIASKCKKYVSGNEAYLNCIDYIIRSMK